MTDETKEVVLVETEFTHVIAVAGIVEEDETAVCTDY